MAPGVRVLDDDSRRKAAVQIDLKTRGVPGLWRMRIGECRAVCATDDGACSSTSARPDTRVMRTPRGGFTPNSRFDRTAGSHSVAAARQREGPPTRAIDPDQGMMTEIGQSGGKGSRRAEPC